MSDIPFVLEKDAVPLSTWNISLVPTVSWRSTVLRPSVQVPSGLSSDSNNLSRTVRTVNKVTL